MKLIFLDIDGVLNSVEHCCKPDLGFPVDFTKMERFIPKAIERVKRLCDEFDAKVVLHSMWRFYFPHQEAAEALGLPIIDCTPPDKFDRWESIDTWLTYNWQKPVDKYVIIDDETFDGWMTQDFEYMLKHLVQTSELVGLTEADYQKARSILQ